MTKALTISTGIFLALTGFAPASAQTYNAHSRTDARVMTYEQCISNQKGRKIAGALIGGLLGAAIGSELHDDSQDYRFDRAYDRGRYRKARRIAREENDGAVLTGAGFGAVAGAAIAGSDENCSRYAHYNSQVGYDDYYGSNNSDYRQDYYYDDPYISDEELVGGPNHERNQSSSRTYEANSAGYRTTNVCRYMTSGGYRTYMCQGIDGIWRPAEN